MFRKISLLRVFTTVILSIILLSSCAGKELIRREVKPDAKEEQVTQNDPFAEIKALPDKTQKDSKEGISVAVDYIRAVTEEDCKCLGIPYNPLNPHLLMAINMMNTSDRVREYSPLFVFKGMKNLQLADKKPCDFFASYGGVTRILAKEGNRFNLNCGEGVNATKNTDSVNTGTTKKITLYPDVPAYGILVINMEGLDMDMKPGTKYTSKVSGHAAFFETPMPGYTPANFRFNYTFERQDWVEEFLYTKRTPFEYQVNVYQTYTDLPILGRIVNGNEVERVAGSERYGQPTLTKIGPAQKKKE